MSESLRMVGQGESLLKQARLGLYYKGDGGQMGWHKMTMLLRIVMISKIRMMLMIRLAWELLRSRNDAKGGETMQLKDDLAIAS